MSSRRHKRPEPCGHENCGSRRFHVGDDGYTYCDQGHQQSERGTVIAEDTGELPQLGRTHRRKESDTELSARSRSRGFTGSQALEHYLLALQLVLRKQLAWLIRVTGLPDELETVVKDLWALRLRKVQNKISYESETDTEGFSQVFSSQSEGESGADTAGSQTTRGSRRKREPKADGSINLNDNLVLCYLGTLLLRIPFSIADLVGYVNDGDFPYYQASRHVPANLRERLPGEYQGLLEPQAFLQPQALQQKALSTASVFQRDFGMDFPAINHALLLQRWMKDLALPLETFAATLRLSRLLEVDFTMQPAVKASSNNVLRYAEVQLMALLMVSTKLLFPLDNIDRYPVSSSDLSVLRMDWNAWFDDHSTKSSSDQNECDGEGVERKTVLSFADAFNVSEADCMTMGDDELDQYLDWYQGNIASENVREQGRAGKEADFRRTMMRMFPVQSHGPKTSMATQVEQGAASNTIATDSLGRVQRSLWQKDIVVSDNKHRGDEVDRTGSYYRRFRDVEELDGAAVRLLYEKSARLAGISLDGMVKAIFLTERRLQKLEEQMRKAQYEE